MQHWHKTWGPLQAMKYQSRYFRHTAQGVRVWLSLPGKRTLEIHLSKRLWTDEN